LQAWSACQSGKFQRKAVEAMNQTDNAVKKPMPVKTEPYQHQQSAFWFAFRLFGLVEGGDATPSIKSRSAALLMEM
jgi:hypothetical protein